MPTIAGCVVLGHNLWLVLAAATVCIGGCWIVMNLFERALHTVGPQRISWLVLAAISAGASIWCTHFVAILAFDAGAPVAFDPILTITSGLTATFGAAAGFFVAVGSRSKWSALVGGALLGGSIAAMHYCGMLAYRVEGLVEWNQPRLAMSLVIAIAFGAASLHLAAHKGPKTPSYAPVALLVAAIVGLHFTDMAALKITPLLTEIRPSNLEAMTALAIAIVAMTALVVGMGAVSYILDVNQRADSFQQMRDMALHDGLTLLPNRTYLRNHLDRIVGEASLSNGKVALVAIDLNGFKEVNDQFGHAAGDAVLKVVSDRLRATLRRDEFGARQGGDEFTVVRAFRSEGEIEELVTRLADVFAKTIETEAFQGVIGGSLGVALFPADAPDVESLLNNADLAMYRAKREQSERAYYYQAAMDERVRARRRMAADLRAAIDDDQLEVHYQVQTTVGGEQIQGFEALARWRRGGRDSVQPSDFIPVAEEYGLIDSLGAVVLRRACSEAATWDPPYRVAVNVSPSQLTRGNLAQTVAGILKETGLDPSRLELELTESAIIRDARASLRAMREIRALGVTLALDDFGTGYSSLSTLRTFPFDKIKLDRTFLGEIETSPQAKAVLRAVLALGDGLGIPVLTEGVETRGQLEMLRAAGCSQAQGYLLGRPAAMSTLVAAGLITLRPLAELLARSATPTERAA